MIVTKKFMKLGTVNIPIGTEIGGLSDGIVSELVSRGLADRKKEPLKKEPEHKAKKEKSEMGF